MEVNPKIKVTLKFGLKLFN